MDNPTTNITTQGVKITTLTPPVEVSVDATGLVREEAKAPILTTEKMQEIYDKATIDLGHNKLLPALYFIFDAFSRGQAQFFLVRQTAKDAIATKQLTGDHIDIGVRKLEWENGNSELVLPFLEQEHVEIIKQEPNFITFTWQDVPFTMHLYDDNPCVTALIPLAYEYETWNIPNQFDRFCTEFDK